MRASDYEYELPPERIARYPAERRDESLLLVVHRDTGRFEHRVFRDLVGLARPGDVLVVNESKVFPARLVGRKPTGAPSEILLLRPVERPGEPADTVWEALVRPGGKLKPGRRVLVADELEVQILDSTDAAGRIVRLVTALAPQEALSRYGHVPLPPYLRREDEPIDRERYQTVYARTPGSVAAPTAGLHFTHALLQELERHGVRFAKILLHVGIGTFRPVESEDPAGHPMHAEPYTVSAEAAEAINAARADGGRLWAVGTTVVRALEAVAGASGSIRPGHGETNLFIRPPYRFRVIDCLVTNFHLPRSTLLMLVAAFAGYELTMRAYREAIAADYRFYSYGDAMAIL
ncbi:MAG: tRNA preQ1(34) S-adenosylmethionine ribosyltransferase-isomerase QueA [Gemmatimonadetes bacterium]|nr:tRNA preQ1(34) S-adenosylmethionine ribosyltransferase-isomerase QueA [Gemmatimonadota bacterium]